jgi:hypothetical protein
LLLLFASHVTENVKSSKFVQMMEWANILDVSVMIQSNFKWNDTIYHTEYHRLFLKMINLLKYTQCCQFYRQFIPIPYLSVICSSYFKFIKLSLKLLYKLSWIWNFHEWSLQN